MVAPALLRQPAPARRGAACRMRRVQVTCFSPYTAASISGAEPRLVPGEPHRAFVPLLDPRKHSVPFAAALELQAPGGGAAGAAQQQPPQALAESGLLELRYLLAGCGQLVHADGLQESLEAGSSVLMPIGGAQLVAEGAPLEAEPCSALPCPAQAAADLVGHLSLPQQHRFALLSLVVYFHRSLLDAASPEAHQQQRQQEQEQQQRVSLPGAHPLLLDLLQQQWGDSSEGGSTQQAAAAAAAQRQQFERWQGQAVAGPHELQEGGSSSVIKRALAQSQVFQLPNQTNRLALAFDPIATPQVPLVFGVEVFEGGHRTPPHIHRSAHELFFIVKGEGEAFCNGERLPVGPGSLIVFAPDAVHGIDVLPGAERMYCLELMLPNDHFSEVVRAGREMAGGLEDADVGVIAPFRGCAAAEELVS